MHDGFREERWTHTSLIAYFSADQIGLKKSAKPFGLHPGYSEDDKGQEKTLKENQTEARRAFNRLRR